MIWDYIRLYSGYGGLYMSYIGVFKDDIRTYNPQ